ncbi:MAG: HAD-IA family hydrolase [Sphaerochaetaceae bacterium]
MYEYLCTDLQQDTKDFRVLDHYKMYLRSVPSMGPFSPYLFISHDIQARSDAAKKGMGVLQWEGNLKEQDIEPYLASHDPKLSSFHRLFVFDMGNVVVNDITMLGKIASKLGIDTHDFVSDYLHYEFPLMEGTFTEAQYWQHIRHVFGIPVKGNPFADAFTPTFNEPIVRLIQALRSRGHRVVCATNTMDSHLEILKKMGALDLFDTTYASHQIGLSKPSSQFYTAILASEGISAENTFFLDDRMDNIENSRKLGIAGFLYADLSFGDKNERLWRIFRTYAPHP